MGRRGTYLFKRKGSANWWIRFQYPSATGGTKKIEHSLGTPDRAVAEIRAADKIKAHKITLLLLRNKDAKREMTGALSYESNKIHDLDDGTRAVAVDGTVSFFDQNGCLIRSEPNTEDFVIIMKSTREEREIVRDISLKNVRNEDHVIETWLRHRKLGKHIASEARSAWENFKRITNNKSLEKCSRDDARKLVAHYEAEGNAQATIKKKLGHLRAAVSLAIGERVLTFNPFSNVVPKAREALDRKWEPLTDAEMALVRAHLPELCQGDRILWELLARTGMRLSEAFEIDREFREDGIRFCIVGSKTAASRRRIPLPDAVCDMLPATITSPIFEGSPETSGKRLRHLLRKLGISYHAERRTGDRLKVVHSLRHRAKDRLRAARCPLEVQYELLGHEHKTVAAGYGHGSPVADLKIWIEKIGG